MKYFITVLITILFCAGFFKYTNIFTKDIIISDTIEIIKIDTVRDSVIVPKYINHIKWDTINITEFKIQRDTIRDTIEKYVYIPISQYTFTDDSTYMAKVSGYNVTMDYIETYNRTKEIHYIPKKSKYVLSVGPSLGLTAEGKVVPAISINLGFKLKEW